MKLENVITLGFSPTGTTAKVLEAIAEGYGGRDCGHLDFTRPGSRGVSIPPFPECLVVIGVPVYGGRIPLQAAEYLETLDGNGRAAVLVTVYGNRHYDDALLELVDLASERGFRPVAAGAFLGEHSFSTEELPIAAGRPDKEDLERARAFGSEAARRIAEVDSVDDFAELPVPGSRPYKERKPLPEGAPETDAELCTRCGRCVSVCPVGAIDRDRPTVTDGKICTFCCACIRVCPEKARKLTFEPIVAATKRLHENCAERREPEVFFAG